MFHGWPLTTLVVFSFNMNIVNWRFINKFSARKPGDCHEGTMFLLFKWKIMLEVLKPSEVHILLVILRKLHSDVLGCTVALWLGVSLPVGRKAHLVSI